MSAVPALLELARLSAGGRLMKGPGDPEGAARERAEEDGREEGEHEHLGETGSGARLPPHDPPTPALEYRQAKTAHGLENMRDPRARVAQARGARGSS